MKNKIGYDRTFFLLRNRPWYIWNKDVHKSRALKMQDSRFAFRTFHRKFTRFIFRTKVTQSSLLVIRQSTGTPGRTPEINRGESSAVRLIHRPDAGSSAAQRSSRMATQNHFQRFHICGEIISIHPSVGGFYCATTEPYKIKFCGGKSENSASLANERNCAAPSSGCWN